jgi:MtrB/PioB family decaheme-associated outer membrane protein
MENVMRLQHACFTTPRFAAPRFATRLSVLAVRGAFLALAFASLAHAADKEAEDPAVAELTRPASQVEVGLVNVDRSSAKFGEYNGLGKSGVYGIGNVDLHGGGAYDSNDATRWNVRGNNLGLENRDLSADYGVQGKFKLNFGYGELRHNLSDSFQTPYQGAGSGNFTLPSNWLKPIVPQVNATALNFRALSPVAGTASSLTGAPTPAQLSTLQGIRDADVPAFQNVELKTKRKTWDGGFGYNFGPQWEFTASYRHETKNGTKPIGVVSTISTFESTVILPDLVDTSTDQYNLGLNYTGDKGFAQVGFHSTLFKNKVTSLTWQDPSNLATSSTISSTPNNQFHQLNLTGGYNFSPATKLVMNAGYGRNTQNDSFLTDPQLPLGIPQSSLNGLVVSKDFNLKLTARPRKGLNLAAGYKFDDRDNRSPVNTYVFYDINQPKTGASSFNTALGLPAGTLGSNVNIYNNRPQSKRLNQFNLDADYAVAKGHTLAAGYEYQKIDRHCNGTWIECVDANSTRENALRAEWRARLSEDLSSNVRYTYSRRTVDYNSNAWLALVPMANVVPGAPTVGATTSAYGYLQQTGLTGFGPIAGFPTTPLTGNAAIFTPGNNIVSQALYASRDNVSENPGMRRFNLADRNRDRFRSSVNWEATEKLSLHGGLDFNQDDYRNSPLGLQNAKGWALNLDGGYSFSEAFGVNLFYTYEDQRSKQAGWNFVANAPGGVPSTITGGCFADTATKNLNNKIDPCNAWSSDSRDRTDTLGLTLRHKNLMGGKLDAGGSLVYSHARTDIGVRGGNYATIPGTTNLVYIHATDVPTVSSDSLELRLSGQYALDKSSSVRMLYAVKRLKTSDFAFDGRQFGTLTTVMPTNEQAPQYTVHVIGISYVHNF